MATLLKSKILDNIDGGSYTDWYKMKVEVYLNSQSVTNNTSNITIKRFYATKSNSAGWYEFTTPKLTSYLSINGGSWTNLGSTAIKNLPQNKKDVWVQFGSWTGNVSHKSDGTQYINVRTSFTHGTSLSTYPYLSQNASMDTGSFSITTIPRTSVPTLSKTSFNIGNSITINTNRYSTSFTHTIRAQFGSWSKTLATGVATSYIWNTSTDANDLYEIIPNKNTGTGYIYVDTYSGSTKIGTKSVTFTANVVNSNPIFNAEQLTYFDSDNEIVGITENNQHIVRNMSNLKVLFTEAIGQNYATISNYTITFNNTTQTLTEAGELDYGTINLSGDSNITIKITDSRGNTTSVTKIITILDWINPTAIITAGRQNNYEDDTLIKAKVNISSVNSKNEIVELKYRYKKTADENWSDYVEFQNEMETTVIVDKLYAWNFQILIVDKFGNTTYNFVVPKGMPIMFFDTEKISVGINRFPINESSLDVDVINGKSIVDLIYPIGSIYMAVNEVNPETLFGGKWEQLKDRFLLGAGDTYSNGSTGGASTVTLTTSQMPSHTHTQASCTDPGNHKHSTRGQWMTAGSSNRCVAYQDISTDPTQTNSAIRPAGAHTHTIKLNNTGGGGAHENMPPYLTVFMWKRVL